MAAVAGRMRVGNEPPSGVDEHLTAREREIVAMVAEGKTNAQVAADLWVSPATVKKHLENVYQKLGVGSRAAAVGMVRTIGQ
jgi:DNA-binding CsgD family transcriptional regulator